MYKQITCLDLLQISTKTKIPINKLSKEVIEFNMIKHEKIIYKKFPSIIIDDYKVND